ncbi:MAG: hypothetical protein Q4A37_01305 [Candidatus Saccharibacteria bacterium]|nr:hypothetical protein [Candidatus Saccharibacteria bacterium]
MNRRLFFDLDRTLFRTSDFDQQRWELLEQWYPTVISAAKEQPRQYEFFIHDDDLYAYDFTAHMTALGLDVGEVMQRLRQSALADGRLEYDGVPELMQWAQTVGRVAVLTYGPDGYQRLKAALCPSLKGIEVVVVQRPKHEYFRQQLMPGGVWMVDDKPIGDELPEGVAFIQVAGYNELSVPAGAMWPVATTVSEVAEIVGRHENIDYFSNM